MVCAFPAMELTSPHRVYHMPPTIHQIRNCRLGGQGPLCQLKTTQKKKGILNVAHGTKTDKLLVDRDEVSSQLLFPLDIVEIIHSSVLIHEFIMKYFLDFSTSGLEFDYGFEMPLYSRTNLL